MSKITYLILYRTYDLSFLNMIVQIVHKHQFSFNEYEFGHNFQATTKLYEECRHQ